SAGTPTFRRGTHSMTEQIPVRDVTPPSKAGASGRNGRMPAQEAILGHDKVHLLAAYVYSLSQQPEQ
ncbi:hypothetical protein, partial [Streptococcus pneumoniae]|uniref:hypothetical protein n=1 Tax=Streptococcus pneumoniae TaxID=1313 RepID=UPI001E50A117